MLARPDRRPIELPVPARHSVRRGVLAASLIVLAVAVSGCGSSGSTTSTTTVSEQAPALRGLVPTPMPPKPSFTLSDTSGQPYDFVAATRGKLTYLFFGYTHCPDQCPATMGNIAYALRSQPAAIRRKIAVVFVTVDPTRDTGPVIRRWLDHYNRTFVGLTGTAAQIAAVERQAGVPPAPPSKGGKRNYEVAHSSILFAYSPDGKAHVVYAFGFKPGDYAHDAPLLLRYT